jgi:hypothetical protein
VDCPILFVLLPMRHSQWVPPDCLLLLGLHRIRVQRKKRHSMLNSTHYPKADFGVTNTGWSLQWKTEGVHKEV